MYIDANPKKLIESLDKEMAQWSITSANLENFLM